MGPNGSGKSTLSHIIMGKPGYEVLGGSVTLDGVDVLALEPWERAVAGLYLLSLIHISEPTRLLSTSYADFCLKKNTIQQLTL